LQSIEGNTYGKLQKITFSLGNFTQWYTNTSFNTWVLAFYFTAVGLRIEYIAIAFITWSIWNAVNDPLIGLLSDRIRTRWGRRKPFIIIGSIPIAIIFLILWIPPSYWGNIDQIANFTYLIIMLFSYDTFYTMIALPYDSLFPELYSSVEERAEVNTYRQAFSSFGLIVAFLVPGLLIEELTSFSGYIENGIVTAIAVLVSLGISIKWGVKERIEFKEDHKKSSEMGFFNSLKYTLRSTGFILYTIIFLSYDYLLLVLGAVIPLYSKYVLSVSGTLETGIMLGVLFIIGLVSIILIWKKLDKLIGSKKGFFISLLLYWIPSIGLVLINSYIFGIITVIFMAPGFGGMLYYVYLIISDVIDEDEIKHGVRREGAFFGITNFFMRLAGVFSILTISLIFYDTGWAQYTPNPGINVIFGLQILVFVFPSIAILIIVVCLYFFPFTKKHVEENKEKLEKIHYKKLKKYLEQ